MAESKTGLIKVIAPGGNAHIVPAANRKVINTMNKGVTNPEKLYKIYDFDPKNPDAIPPEEPKPGFSEVVNKMAVKLSEKDREIAELKAQLDAVKTSKPKTVKP